MLNDTVGDLTFPQNHDLLFALNNTVLQSNWMFVTMRPCSIDSNSAILI